MAKSASCQFLDPPFARAAKKLPAPGSDLREMSIKMGGGGGGRAWGDLSAAAGGRWVARRRRKTLRERSYE